MRHRDVRQQGGQKIWLYAAGLATWLAVAVAAASTLLATAGTNPAAVAWWLCWIAFGAAFIAQDIRSAAPGRGTVHRVLALGQVSLALAVSALTPDGLPGVAIAPALTVVAAARLTPAFIPSLAICIVAAQTAALAAIYLVRGWGWANAIPIAGAYGAFALFAVLVSTLAERERQTSRSLEAALTDLRMAQADLATRQRREERLRMSRDVHDVLGHHLTALALRLEAARHQAGGDQHGAVREIDAAAGLARTALDEMRSLVAGRRAELAEDIRHLAASVGDFPDAPQVSLELDEPLSVDDPACAEAALRVVQEALTNVMRHSSAAHVRITCAREGDRLRVIVRDDGVGSERGEGAASVNGHGLRGMRERIDALGGVVRAEPAADGGFVVDATLPICLSSRPRAAEKTP